MSNWAYLNKCRVREGNFASDDSYGFNGYFRVMVGIQRVKVVASDGEGWQHVSVSLNDNPSATPRWDVMSTVKDLFWEDEDMVIQIHPKKSEYVNHHPGCLHLWRCTDGRDQPTPPSIFVGPK